MNRLRPRAALAALALAALAVACAPDGRPRIDRGAPCVACSMAITDLRFASARRDGGRWRAYDSIECLLRDAKTTRDAWLADYDTRTLHPADSMWVVRGEFSSPMGGGLAAFVRRAAADQVAAETRGQVGRFGPWAIEARP